MQRSRRFTIDVEEVRALNSVGWVQQSRIFTTDREDLDLRGTVLVGCWSKRICLCLIISGRWVPPGRFLSFPTMREYKNEPRKAQTSTGCVSLFLLIA